MRGLEFVKARLDLHSGKFASQIYDLYFWWAYLRSFRSARCGSGMKTADVTDIDYGEGLQVYKELQVWEL